eukprot:9850440-Heterocapsa_arctica.AAC.1
MKARLHSWKVASVGIGGRPLISPSEILTLGLCEWHHCERLPEGVPGGESHPLGLRGGGGGVGLRPSSLPSSSSSSGSS